MALASKRQLRGLSKAGATIINALRRNWSAYRLRWKRRELLWRAIRSVRKLSPIADRTSRISTRDILLFAVIRNEASRLPEFLEHYRKLGVNHFLIVDNGSNDASATILRDQADISIWRSYDEYRATRFGMDLIGALLLRYGHDHWCLTVDADELLIYPDWDRCDLAGLTVRLDSEGVPGMGALMLDLYPSGPLGEMDADINAPLVEQLPWFDAGPYRSEIAEPKRNRIVKGGVRERAFFTEAPELSPTLNKLPLIRWNWRYVYVNSTHSLLPPKLNDLYDGPEDQRLSGILLHGKFLPGIIQKSVEDLTRRQHFIQPERYTHYHRAIVDRPVLWHNGSCRFRDWEQLVELGLMGNGERSQQRNEAKKTSADLAEVAQMDKQSHPSVSEVEKG